MNEIGSRKNPRSRNFANFQGSLFRSPRRCGAARVGYNGISPARKYICIVTRVCPFPRKANFSRERVWKECALRHPYTSSTRGDARDKAFLFTMQSRFFSRLKNVIARRTEYGFRICFKIIRFISAVASMFYIYKYHLLFHELLFLLVCSIRYTGDILAIQHVFTPDKISNPDCTHALSQVR